MNRHAYLLLVHGNQPVTKSCISLLDDERNDIFVLADKEERYFYRNIELMHSHVYILEWDKPVVWGGSVWDAELELIKEAVKAGGVFLSPSII